VYDQVVNDAYRLTSSLHIPWLIRYRQACDSCTNSLTHDQFHCPAIIVFVATTMEHYDDDDNRQDRTTSNTAASRSSDIVATIRALQSNYHYWPVQYRNGMFDPTLVRREVLILHDNVEYMKRISSFQQSPPTEFDETSIRTQIKVCFGATASILQINSLALETAQQLAREEQSDIWGQLGQVGHCLTVGDRARIRKYIQHLISNAVIPSLERRVSDLNLIVNDRKKEVKNVLKNLWGGNTRNKPGYGEQQDDNTNDLNHTNNVQSSSNNQNNTDIIYKYDSIESQTQLLSDTLFLLRDYDTALSMYRLIKDDYKQDRNWVYYGSVQEMMALCMYMIDSYGRT
jgi:trafficking protein particle complex subunit 8